ncbi:MAG: M48 family metalloprotease [Hyphomicrobiaceae bacterium]|nr:M48 family metalloprotease [Hyphomicrobiaceae bacterium]
MSPFLAPRALAEHRQRNLIHSALILGGMGGLVALAAYLLSGPAGVVASLLVVAGLAVLAPQVPPETVMRIYSARLVVPGSDPLSRLVDELAARGELERRPQLYIVPSATLNAFATGTPGHAAIALTEGLVRRLTLREIAGVIGHEISHIRNNDLALMGLADIMTRFVQMLSYVALGLMLWNMVGMASGDRTLSWWGILLLYLAPTCMSLLQLGLSRAREFDADLEGAMLTGDPLGLASALARLERYTGQFWEDLVYPVPGRRVPQPSLLRSHPETHERIARLQALTADRPLEQITVLEGPMLSPAGFGPQQMRPRHRFPGLWY